MFGVGIECSYPTIEGGARVGYVNPDETTFRFLKGRRYVPSGAAFDRMFLQMMIRHHEGAIEMARAASQQGQHPDVRELAEKVVADQAAEIDEMRELLATR